MRRIWPVLGPAWMATSLLLLAALNANASGVGLRWNACVADGGLANRSFACNTNMGALFLVTSFVLDAPLTNVKRVDVSLELASASPTLPAWWDLVSCRSGARYAVSGSEIAPTVCTNLGWSAGINGIVIGEHGPNTERIEIGSARFDGQTIAAGPEYVAVVLRLTVLGTVGSGACGGCEIPVCLVVRSVSLSFATVLGQPPGFVLSHPLNGTDANYATWQGGGSPVVGGVVGCPAATPVRRLVWGSVKSLYR